MKIVYLYPQFARTAGTERVLIDKMNYLAENYGYDVIMMTTEQGNHPLAFPLSDKVLHIDLSIRYCDIYKRNILIRYFKKKRFDNLFQMKFNALMGEYRPDIVITTTYDSKYLSVINNCPYSFRRVLESHIDKQHLHQNDPNNKRNIWRYINAYFGMKKTEHDAGKFDVMVTLNENDAKEWGKILKTIIITNVVNLNPTKLYSSQNSNQIIFVGRYTIQKGVHELFVIWDYVYKRHPDWHLNLYGTGELRDYVLYNATHSHKNIHHHEPDNHIHDRYIENTILVMPSVYEPFGLVLIEAMSCGLPVVAYDDLVGPKSIIKDHYDGFLIPNRDISLFGEKVCQLIESKELRIKMGRNAIKSSLRYSPSVVMPKWNSLFMSLCNNV